MSERNPDSGRHFAGRLIEAGIFDCIDCGEPHDCIETQAGERWGRTWAASVDGHFYRPSPGNTVARLRAELAAARARG